MFSLIPPPPKTTCFGCGAVRAREDNWWWIALRVVFCMFQLGLPWNFAYLLAESHVRCFRRLTFVVAESGLSFIQKSGAGEHFAAHQGSQRNCDTSSPHILSSSLGVPFTRGRCSADCCSAGTTNLRNFARMHRHQPCRPSILVVCPAFSRCTNTEGPQFFRTWDRRKSHTQVGLRTV